MKVTFSPFAIPGQGTVVLTVALGQKLGPQGVRLDKKTGGALKRAMAAGGFTGKRDETLVLLAPAKTKLDRVILLGLGKPADLTETTAQGLGGSLAACLGGLKARDAILVCDTHDDVPEQLAVQMAFGAKLRSYRFDKYFTKKRDQRVVTLRALAVQTATAAVAKKDFPARERLADSVILTRNLVSEPGNIIYPISLAEQCKALTELGVKVDILDEKQMAKLGMGALLGVAQGSANPPRMAIMKWQGDPTAKDQSPVALVGKGVTFDTGGISIKPSGGMEEMKFDMAGAAAVIGTMRALAANKLRANVVGLIGLVENMPSGTAQRPGDIVTSMSGQTIEVHNTDAEGRLVLADVVWYAQETFKPKVLIDLATLTGAAIIALGHEFTGLFANDEALATKLEQAAKKSAEPVWRLPLCDTFDKQLDAEDADMKNISAGREAGSSIGAQFIQRFVQKGTSWAHLDIAGTAWIKRSWPTAPKGATGFGVRLLYQYIQDHHTAA